MKGSPIRQEYLETALSWINDGRVEEYMSKHHHDATANELWKHFQKVITWVRNTFQHYRKEMAGVEWGALYEEFKDDKLNAVKLEAEIEKLMQDEDVTSKSGVYQYVLTKEERFLSIRAFTLNMKREAYERQKGICSFCKKKFEIEEMEADHIKPWHEGGRTIATNCQMLCKNDNRTKSGK